jgi:glycosyltransferase involved in cell wall biosynthesis
VEHFKGDITVLVCTHNPRLDFLNRVLQSLREQNFPRSRWKLLIIDNASDIPLSRVVDLSWHPHAKIIRENTLGLTPARLRGITESDAELLIFVDDDNVLEPNYLEIAHHISASYPIVGAWGGQITLEFEQPPPMWAKPFFPMFGDRAFDHDRLSNFRYHSDTTPCGAGLCVRQTVAQKYVELVACDPKRLEFDRKGQQLMSCGDSDLALTACDMGLFTGQFSTLQLTHLISAHRLQESYLIRLAEGMGYSHITLCSLRNTFPPAPSWKRRLRWFLERSLRHPKSRQIYHAFHKGETLALQELNH